MVVAIFIVLALIVAVESGLCIKLAMDIEASSKVIAGLKAGAKDEINVLAERLKIQDNYMHVLETRVEYLENGRKRR